MTAIFGLVHRSAVDSVRLRRMTDALAHRRTGPARILSRDGVALGMVPPAGAETVAQMRSFISDCGRIRIVADGLIRFAGPQNISCSPAEPDRGNCNAEALARLYETSGPGCFERLRGAFAVAIWDERDRQLVLARDHLGHKPLYYSESTDGISFASETKALLAASPSGSEVDSEALSHFLTMRFVPAPYSLIKGVRKLPPAHVLVHKDGKSELRRYWTLSFRRKHALAADELIDGLDAKLLEATRDNLSPHGETGSFLSAGLDSGLIVAYMADILGRAFPTFSLGVDDETDEVPTARLVSTRFGTIHHEAYPSSEIVRLLPTIIWHVGEPTDMVAISKYFGAQLAAPHVPAVMAGDGGDELFGGFDRYLGVQDADRFSRLPWIVRRGAVAPIARFLAGPGRIGRLARKAVWVTDVAEGEALPERYARAVAHLRFGEADKCQLFTQSAWREVAHIDSNRILAGVMRESDADNSLEKMLFVDFLTRLPEHLLMLNHRAGAAHGIEVICPLADRDLVEYVAAIPPNMKLRHRQLKYIERRLAEKRLPKEVVRFRKTGWSFPFAQLCAGDWQPFLRRVFGNSRLVLDGIFREEFMKRLLDEHRTGQADHHIRIWMLLTTEIWYRMMTSGSGPEELTAWVEDNLAPS